MVAASLTRGGEEGCVAAVVNEAMLGGADRLVSVGNSGARALSGL
jgi:hypothetical protein